MWVNTSGYDAPAASDDDVLDRRRFARGIARLATETPPLWAVRIGVYGEWGSGKTTVLKYVEDLVKKEGHVVVHLNPWHAENSGQLWTRFALAVHEAASAVGVKSSSKIAKKIIAGKVVEVALDGASIVRSGSGKFLGSVADAAGVRSWLTAGEQDVRRVAEAIAPRRVIVVVDDLDRAKPSLVPEVLFMLREILDCPGFSFILAFDPKIVIALLRENYGTEQFGVEFLEKIIDFPRELPVPTENQLRTLAEAEIEARCAFVPSDALRFVLPLLPARPRAVKRFVQHLMALKGEVARYDADELHWPILLLSQVLILHSRVLADKVLTHPDLLGASVENTDESQMSELVEFADREVPKGDRKYVIEIVSALQRAGGVNPRQVYRDHADLLDRPPAVTQKEYRSFREQWSQTRVPATVEAGIRAHADAQDVSPARVFEALWNASVARYEYVLSQAADVNGVDAQQRLIVEAGKGLDLLEQLAIEMNGFSQPRLDAKAFRQLWSLAMSWVHFTNQPYPDLRRREEAILQAICSSAKPELQRQLLAVIQPWRPAKTLREEARELKLRLVESLAIPLFDALLDALERPTGLAIHASDVEHGLDTFLLVGDHGVRWTDARLDRLKALAERAREDPIIHENMVDFAARMREPISGFPEHPRRHVAELLWQGMIAQPLQYRSIGSHRQTKKFLERAVGESLPTPEWWDVLGPREDENTLST